MENYLALRPTTLVGPLFVNSLGEPLTKQELTRKTRQLLSQAGFQASNFAGHSYRIGAATTAASAKLPSWLIKTLGRWSSDCYERYIRTPPSTLLNVSATLAKDLSCIYVINKQTKYLHFTSWEEGYGDTHSAYCGDGVPPKVNLHP